PALEHGLGLVELADAAGGDDRRLPPGAAHRRANRRGEVDVAAERAVGVAVDRRHAFVAGAPGIWVRRPADLGLLGILELAALGDRQKLQARAGELDPEPRRILQVVA